MSNPLRSFHASPVVGFGLLSVLVVLAGCGQKAKPAAKNAGGGGAPVVVTKVEKKVIPVVIDAIGAVEPIRTTGVRAQITGIVQKVNFKEGQEVKQNDVLFEIDPRPFQNALRSAEADQQKASVQLDTAVAEVTRYKGLSEQGMVSKEQFLTIQTNERTARAALAAADAAKANDQVQLEYCTIRAPFDGLTGSLGVHEGDLVRASDANIAMVTINQISPVYVTYGVPQQNLAAITLYRSEGSLIVNATPPGTGEAPEKGELTFIDNAIDASTGTLKLKATFLNSDRRLWPGQFANVRLVLASPEVVVIPTPAVQNDQTGQHVFIVREDKTAELRTITVERSVDGQSVITKGLTAGETVVLEGQLRVLPGKPVQIKTAGQVDDGGGATTPAQDSDSEKPKKKAKST